MRLNSLSLTNFRQHAETRLDFGVGLIGIIGPNGAGKSTLLEAIAWAIYGNAAARGTREGIRFHRAPARAAVRVEVDFHLGGHRYRVVRGLTSAELYLDSSPAPIASGINAVTDLLRKHLAMTREEFFNTYFTGQKELSVMAAMGAAERAQFLSRVLGYERLRAAQDIVRRRRSVIVGEIAGLRQGMPDADQVRRALEDAESRLAEAGQHAHQAAGRRRDADVALADVAPRWEQAQRDRDQLQALLSDLRVAEGEEAALHRDMERLDRDLAEIGAAREQLELLGGELARLPGLVADLQRLDVLAREEGRRAALLDQRSSLGAELAKLRGRLTRLAGAPALERETTTLLATRRDDLTAADSALEARRSEWARDQQEAETKRDTLRKQYQELKVQYDQLVAAGRDGVCPTCTRPLGDSYQGVMELLAEQMETVRVDGRYYKDRLEQLKHPPDDMAALDDRRRALYADVTAQERRLARVQVARAERAQLGTDVEEKSRRDADLERELAVIPPGYDAGRHESVRRDVDRLTRLDQTAQMLQLHVTREDQVTNERARIAETLAVVAGRLEEIREQRAAAAFSEQRFTELREAHVLAADELRLAELAGVSAEANMAGARDALLRARGAANELAERQRLLRELDARRRLHDELDRSYNDLRGELNADLRPELSELASRLLGGLTDGRYAELELDDQYNIVVHEDGLPKPVISGGEEDLANLVLRLAISQMIADRAGQPLSLLILDEIFGSLDETHRANVVGLLRRLGDRFEQVILITHIETVREGLDRVITVRYDESSGSSVVEKEGEDRLAAAHGEDEAPLFTQAGAAD
ncbi:MAG: SMC family ATPase [Gemmatimonadota bacterium]|nr:SMC family ATPase [Gemmatimonadota bacterium]